MWSRSLAAALLGLPCTTGLIGLVLQWWPGDPVVHTLPWLLMAFPVWIAVMSLAFSARSRSRAWLALAGITGLCFALIEATKLIVRSAGSGP